MRTRRLVRLSRIAAALLVALVAAAMFLSVVVSRPQFDERLDRSKLAEIPIAPPGEALTFARFRRGDNLRLLLVTRYASDQVTGADLGEFAKDALYLIRERGFDAILPLAAKAPSVTVPVADLDLPFDAPAQNIGIGTNYREHARQSGLEEQPFVFPKIAQPTPSTLPGLAQQIGVGSDDTCALVAGSVYCWGSNNQGQLGVNTPTIDPGCSSACSLLPKQVVDVASTPDSASSPLTAVADLNVAYHAACARRTDHSLYCWGNGSTNFASPLIMDAAPLTNVLLHTTVGSGTITSALRVFTRDNVLKRQNQTYTQVCP